MNKSVSHDVGREGKRRHIGVVEKQFDRRAAEVATEQEWPSPPKANAIYMHLTRQRKRNWRELVESALLAAGGSLTQTVGAAVREFPAWWFDERHIIYGLRRLLHFRNALEANYEAMTSAARF